MNILYIDAGNSAIKWLFNGQYHHASIEDFELNLLPTAEQIWVSCVAQSCVLKALKTANFVKSPSKFQAFTSAYSTPETLGIDRFLTMLACTAQQPDKNILIIDAGTAVTLDLALSGEHQGGLIMPGLGTLRRSFLPFATDSKNLAFELADNTLDAWQNGTANMLMGAINAQIQRYLKKYSDLNIILTGGDGEIVARQLDYQAEFNAHLVLDGLVLYAQSRP